MKIEEVVGHHIAHAREKRGASQQDLAEDIGKQLGRPWTRQAVWAAEKGRRAFTAAELVAFALVLGVPVSHLLTPPPGATSIELLDSEPLDRDDITFALHAFGREPVRSEAITPMVLLKVQSIARELRSRVGHDMAAAQDLEDFYARMMSSMRGVPADEVTE